jgi:hypothetical protein
MFVLAVLSVVTAAELVAAPRSDLSPADRYSESLRNRFSYSERETLDSSNCPDACAAIWGQYVNEAATAPRTVPK